MGPRLRVALLLMISLAAAGSFLACSGGKAAAPGADAARQSLAGLSPQLQALNKKFAGLHKQFDPLPMNLPGFHELRAKFYATDEGLGIMGPKITWLSGRLDAALKPGKHESLQQVSQDIAETYREMRLIDRIAGELAEQVLPFQKMALELPQE